MDVHEAIRIRRSVRSYLDKPVPESALNRILEAGRLAPSANNLQPWHFVVVTDQAKREELSHGRWARFLKDCPVVIVGCGDRAASPKWHPIDVAIAMQQMVIAATADGLGTCWIGSFDEDVVRRILKVPENYRVVAMLAVGYPKEPLEPTARLRDTRRRKPIAEIVSYETFGGSTS
ncbi:MAG: nitroreductase family protein [Thermoplasmata archaeon]